MQPTRYELEFVAGENNALTVSGRQVRVIFDPSQQSRYSRMLHDLCEALKRLRYPHPEHVQVFARDLFLQDILWQDNRWAGKDYSRTFTA